MAFSFSKHFNLPWKKRIFISWHLLNWSSIKWTEQTWIALGSHLPLSKHPMYFVSRCLVFCNKRHLLFNLDWFDQLCTDQVTMLALSKVYFDDDNDDELFSWYGWPMKGVRPFSSRDHCQRSSPSQICLRTTWAQAL